MATIIEIQENKLENLTEYAEKVLRYSGKLMQCLEELDTKSKHNEYRNKKEYWDNEHYNTRYY